MKTLIFYLVMMVLGTSHAQEFTELKEAKVEFAPLSSNVERNGNNISFKVKESHRGQFEKDPLAFMEYYFDIDNYIKEMGNKDFERYEINLKSGKGSLKASFNKDGELMRSSSRFKNTVLPENLRHQLYRDHKGWAMTENVHITHSRSKLIRKDFYKVKLQKGEERKKIILKGGMEGVEVVFN